jgi:hypothetical protein
VRVGPEADFHGHPLEDLNELTRLGSRYPPAGVSRWSRGIDHCRFAAQATRVAQSAAKPRRSGPRYRRGLLWVSCGLIVRLRTSRCVTPHEAANAIFETSLQYIPEFYRIYPNTGMDISKDALIYPARRCYDSPRSLRQAAITFLVYSEVPIASGSLWYRADSQESEWCVIQSPPRSWEARSSQERTLASSRPIPVAAVRRRSWTSKARRASRSRHLVIQAVGSHRHRRTSGRAVLWPC